MARSKFIKGGRKLDKFFRDAKRAAAAQPKAVQVGFFAESKDKETGLPLAHLAALQEFGKPRPPKIPERPAFRLAIHSFPVTLKPILTKLLDPRKMAVSRAEAKAFGNAAAEVVKRSYEALSSPANAAATLKKKSGSSPLIDKGELIKAIKSRVLV